MHDALAITEADAQGLADVAEVQLRLAKRFGERAEAEEDVDKACRLARACERAARGYRQSLLIKARLKRDGDRDRRDAVATPLPRTPQQQERMNRRVRLVYEAVEAVIDGEIDAERLRDDAIKLWVLDKLDEEAKDDAFLAEDVAAHVARICEAFDLPVPGAQVPSAIDPRAAPDSS